MTLDPPTLARLVESARTARANAHAPYSGCRVGAAVLADTGSVYAGCNVENASYGLAICAERNAVASAVAAGERRFVGAVVVTDATPPWSPCGACRQVLAEFGDFPVVLANLAGVTVNTSVAELLPRAFSVSDLELPGERP